jgi:single-strand DNA-binding protein
MATNMIFLHGFVGKDAELKTTTNNKPMARFSLATTETWKDQQGVKQSKTEWHQIVVWGTKAESVAKIIRKGQELLVKGKLEYNEDKEKKITYAFIKLIDFDFCGKRGDSGNSNHTPDPEFSGREDNREFSPEDDGFPASAPSSSAGSFDDDVPF